MTGGRRPVGGPNSRRRTRLDRGIDRTGSLNEPQVGGHPIVSRSLKQLVRRRSRADPHELYGTLDRVDMSDDKQLD